MNRRWLFIVCVWMFGSLLGVGLGTAISQQAPPTETKGLQQSVVASLDLGPEIEGMEGRQLRMRMLTLEPGGIIALHSHKDRPAVARVLQGTLTEYREGGYTKEHPEGDSWAEGKDTTHWAGNRGTTPVVAVVVDIIKP